MVEMTKEVDEASDQTYRVDAVEKNVRQTSANMRTTPVKNANRIMLKAFTLW